MRKAVNVGLVNSRFAFIGEKGKITSNIKCSLIGAKEI